MIHQSIFTGAIRRSFAALLLGLILLGLAGCGPAAREGDIEPAEALVQSPSDTPVTSAPTSPELSVEVAQEAPEPASVEPIEAMIELPDETVTEAGDTLAPTGQIVLPEVRLPPSDVENLEMIAEANGLTFASLAVENTVIYALPASDDGIVFLLTPTVDSPGFSTKEIATKNPDLYANRMLGGLTVVRRVNDGLPDPRLPTPSPGPDNYVITLSADASKVLLTDITGAIFEFDAVIRALPRRLPRPTALITTSQMSLAWDATQISFLVNSPLPDNWLEKIQLAISDLQSAGFLQAGEEAFVLERTVPDIEGVQGLQRCADALTPSGDDVAPSPSYANCWATVLAAPAVADGAFPLLPDRTQVPPDISTGIGLIIALDDGIQEEVFLDPELTQPAIDPDRGQLPLLPPGNYLTYGVRFEDDRQIDDTIFERRVLQFGPPGEFYLPSVEGAVIIGNPVGGADSANENEAIIVNLWIRGRCYFRARQCPWLQ